ncbi:hypothetical protein O6P43_008976 [Quillaja saponaria]|uniref:Uncharacterized protein n=1 Tax=Quillaja saponaria TaxID=32244 RepID=A0AAD7PX87_QUISA|nr:hypothetical protein O6P43_008976 [Quillaja saponaria]
MGFEGFLCNSYYRNEKVKIASRFLCLKVTGSSMVNKILSTSSSTAAFPQVNADVDGNAEANAHVKDNMYIGSS